MTRDEMVGILAPVALAFRAPMDAAQWRVYFSALEDVPVRLLHEAAVMVLRQERTFMPTTGEIRRLADQARLKLLEAVPYTGCADCHGTSWRPTEARTVERCPCKQAHLERLSALGLGPPLTQPQLTDGEMERFDPRMAATGEGR